MHVLVMRRMLNDQVPHLARELFETFLAAKDLAAHDGAETAEVHAMDPWLYAHVEEARDLMGADYWPYGVEANRAGLEAFLRYAHEQGLTDRRMTLGELFAAGF